jgi:hypothetical protein
MSGHTPVEEAQRAGVQRVVMSRRPPQAREMESLWGHRGLGLAMCSVVR